MGGPNFIDAGPLQINSASPSYFLNGNLGIGTTGPAGKLQVVTSDDPTGNLPAFDSRHFVVGADGASGAGSGGIFLSYDRTNNRGYIGAVSPGVAWRNLILQPISGNVGIGTTTPGAKLEVNGAVKAGLIGISMTTGGAAVGDRISQTSPNQNLAVSANGSGVLYLNFDGGDALEVRNNQGTARMRIDASGHVTIAGALSPIYGRAKVGIVSNGFDDLIFNYGDADSGAVYWFKNPTNGREQGTSGTQMMKLDVDGKLYAANNLKVYDSGWFPISGLGTATKAHGLGTLPKFVIVWCAESPTPAKMSVAGPFHVDSSGVNERGAYVDQCDATNIHVRAGNYIGINEAGNGWLTSGYYKIIAWA